MKKSRITNEARKGVYRRDGYQCAVCGDNRRLQIHHITKRSQGGGDDQMNLITLCSTCHALAHGINLVGVDLTPEDVSQTVVEYMADYYAELGLRWPDGKELTAVYGTPVPEIALSHYLIERKTRHEDECARLFGDFGEKIGAKEEREAAGWEDALDEFYFAHTHPTEEIADMIAGISAGYGRGSDN